jgi:hypothetical protein
MGVDGDLPAMRRADAEGALVRYKTGMHVTMVKKKLADGSDCRKCADVTALLERRGLWGRIDEVVWALEGDPSSPGVVLGARLGVASAPFFIVRDDRGEAVYTSALQLIQERLGEQVTSSERARDVDPDDVGGI